MKRDILFRGKATNRDPFYTYRTKYKNGDWVYGLLTDCENYTGFAEMTNTDGVSRIDVDKNTVGQYTGLTDKNGKKIFEGDVVEFESHGYIPDVSRGCVIFKDGCYGIEFVKWYGDSKGFHRIGSTSEWQDMGASGTITYTYEIIGNIYDNPELLKGADICKT